MYSYFARAINVCIYVLQKHTRTLIHINRVEASLTHHTQQTYCLLIHPALSSILALIQTWIGNPPSVKSLLCSSSSTPGARYLTGQWVFASRIIILGEQGCREDISRLRPRPASDLLTVHAPVVRQLPLAQHQALLRVVETHVLRLTPSQNASPVGSVAH